MSATSTDTAIPAPWTAWRTSVVDLVTTMLEMVRLFKNPNEPRDDQWRTQWMKLRASIRTRQAECKSAADVVGGFAKRGTVSRPLRGIQRKAEKLANRMLKQSEGLNLDDANAVQQWHVELMLTVDHLWLKVTHPDIQEEMEDEVSEGVELPPEKMEALNKVQRAIMKALEGKAMTGEELEAATGKSLRSIFRHAPDLVNRGWLKKDTKVGGYYRPDAPPR